MSCKLAGIGIGSSFLAYASALPPNYISLYINPQVKLRYILN